MFDHQVAHVVIQTDLANPVIRADGLDQALQLHPIIPGQGRLQHLGTDLRGIQGRARGLAGCGFISSIGQMPFKRWRLIVQSTLNQAVITGRHRAKQAQQNQANPNRQSVKPTHNRSRGWCEHARSGRPQESSSPRPSSTRPTNSGSDIAGESAPTPGLLPL